MTVPDQTLREWDKAHLWHPFTAQADWAGSEPLIIDRGEGVYLFDTEGNRYLDGVGSLWCNVHGHRHPSLDLALKDQIDRLAHSTLLGATHAPAVQLARKLAQVCASRAFLASSSPATAPRPSRRRSKMAFQYWHQKADPEPNRTRFLAIGNAYHGDTIGSVSVGGVDRFHAMFSPLLFAAIRAASPYCYRCPLHLERPSCAMACVEEVDRLLGEHPGEVVAVIVEPMVQGAAGMIVQPPGYLRRLREITRKHRTLLIADEVAVGFGKTGKMFACDLEGVSPDLLCLGKGLTGGYLPMAATLATEEVYAAFFATAAEQKTFQHGHTFAGNPLCAAAALANLQVFEDEATLEAAKPKVERLSTRLAGLSALRHVGDVRQCGLIAGIELVADKPSKEPFPWSEQIGAKVCRRARNLGLLIRPLGDVLVIMPPLSISLAQLDEMLGVIETCIREVTEDDDNCL